MPNFNEPHSPLDHPAGDECTHPYVQRYAMRYTIEEGAEEPTHWRYDDQGAPEPYEDDQHSCIPDETDRAEGKTPAMLAAEYIRANVASGQYAASGYPDFPGPGAWYMGEPVTVDNYAGQLEEVSGHLYGFTLAEKYEIWQRVTAE